MRASIGKGLELAYYELMTRHSCIKKHLFEIRIGVFCNAYVSGAKTPQYRKKNLSIRLPDPELSFSLDSYAYILPYRFDERPKQLLYGML